MILRSENGDIDINDRPDTYFRPHKLEQYLLSKVKGAVVRKKLQSLIDEGQHVQVGELLTSAKLSEHDRKLLESVHPMFMGGNYLPDTGQGEVEIARISIQSTTFDVTCVYARKEEGVIHLRVVDEYDGDTLQDRSDMQTTLPLTLEELADFFLQTWPLVDVLESNFEDDLDSALDFFAAESAFYPGFDRLCRQRVRHHFAEHERECDEGEEGDECPVCEYVNVPPADDICEHLCAFVWDGRAEAFGKAIALDQALKELAGLSESAQEDWAVQLILESEAGVNAIKASLIDAASGDVDLVDVLQSLAGVETGSDWSTDGMPGGSGYNVYVSDPATLDLLSSECEAIIQACGMTIDTSNSEGTTLDARRPQQPVDWQLVASGFWSEGIYHSGHIAYYIARVGPGEWILEGLERNVVLDGLTEEDIDAGWVNDDQLQAMWGMTLEEAQSMDYRKIVAACKGAPPHADVRHMSTVTSGDGFYR